MMGPKPELLLEEELELELLDEELLELLLDEELELLDELEDLPLELELLELELELLLELLEPVKGVLPAGSAPQAVRPATRLVAKTAAGIKRANECWRNTNAFMKSSWGCT